MRDTFARAISSLALSGVFILFAYRDHGAHYAFDVALGVFWAVVGTGYLVADIFDRK